MLAFGGKNIGARKDRRQRRRPADGPVTRAVSRDGTSPPMARELRRRIEPAVEGTRDLAAATDAVRTQPEAAGGAAEGRRDALRAAVRSPVVWKDLGAGGSKVGKTVADEVESAPGETE